VPLWSVHSRLARAQTDQSSFPLSPHHQQQKPRTNNKPHESYLSSDTHSRDIDFHYSLAWQTTLHCRPRSPPSPARSIATNSSNPNPSQTLRIPSTPTTTLDSHTAAIYKPTTIDGPRFPESHPRERDSSIGAANTYDHQRHTTTPTTGLAEQTRKEQVGASLQHTRRQQGTSNRGRALHYERRREQAHQSDW
jgi:hypothetical protein